MKRFITGIAIAVTLAGCAGSTAVAFESKTTTTIQKTTRPQAPSFFEVMEKHRIEQAILKARALKAEQQRAAEIAKKLQAIYNEKALEKVISELRSYVGKTRYVFSGHTPKGWDCSGLVYWTYEQLGIQVEHSASKQGHTGEKVSEPQIGDIVAFGYMKSKGYYHSAIYIGDNKVIHAGFKPGRKTEIISLDHPAFKDSRITFRRLIEISN